MVEHDYPVIILCGGRGTRMASLTEYMPKCLLSVMGYPLLWYVLHHFRSQGFRKFILPLGFGGKKVRNWISTHADFSDCYFNLVDTGIDSSLTSRLHQVSEYLQGSDTFFLANADTISLFDLRKALAIHNAGTQVVTLMSMPVRSSLGLILKKGDKVISFERNALVNSVNISGHEGDVVGLLNSGFAIIDRLALMQYMPTLLANVDGDSYEQMFYGEVAKAGMLGEIAMEEYWKAFDSKKDLDSVDEKDTREKIAEIVDLYEGSRKVTSLARA